MVPKHSDIWGGALVSSIFITTSHFVTGIVSSCVPLSLHDWFYGSIPVNYPHTRRPFQQSSSVGGVLNRYSATTLPDFDHPSGYGAVLLSLPASANRCKQYLGNDNCCSSLEELKLLINGRIRLAMKILSFTEEVEGKRFRFVELGKVTAKN